MTSTLTKTAETRKPPVATLKNGLINASIWQRTTEEGHFYSVTFERRYKDGEGNWKTTHSYSRADLLKLAELAEHANIHILNLYSTED